MVTEIEPQVKVIEPGTGVVLTPLHAAECLRAAAKILGASMEFASASQSDTVRCDMVQQALDICSLVARDMKQYTVPQEINPLARH